MYGKRSGFLTFMLVAGLAFFYIPMILLVIYSFNHSKLVPVWGGWSTRWRARRRGWDLPPMPAVAT